MTERKCVRPPWDWGDCAYRIGLRCDVFSEEQYELCKYRYGVRDGNKD